jgi:hypothetical protein
MVQAAPQHTPQHHSTHRSTTAHNARVKMVDAVSQEPHLLGVAECAHELLHGHGLLVREVVALRGQPARVDQDVGVSCVRDTWTAQQQHKNVMSRKG